MVTDEIILTTLRLNNVSILYSLEQRQTIYKSETGILKLLRRVSYMIIILLDSLIKIYTYQHKLLPRYTFKIGYMKQV